jgi:putative endonuclease
MNVIGLRALIVKYSGMRYSSVAMPGLMNEKMYYTYIVASSSHNFYVAMTSEIEIRVQQHKQWRFEGYSKKYNCNRLVWLERHPFVENAIAREKQLEGGLVRRR